jgi:hypothetical protein
VANPTAGIAGVNAGKAGAVGNWEVVKKIHLIDN